MFSFASIKNNDKYIYLDYFFTFSLFLHQPFILYKAIGIESFIIFLQYFILLFLLLVRRITYRSNDSFIILALLLMALPLNLLWGSDYFSFGFFVRLFPSLIYVIYIQNGALLTIKTAYYFFAINIVMNLLMFLLYISGIELKNIDLEYVNGYTIGFLSFAVNTAYFNTGDPLLARLQGWAWEPAAFAISALPLIYLDRLTTDRIISKRFRQILVSLIYLGLVLTKSIAFFVSYSIRILLINRKLAFLILLIFIFLFFIENDLLNSAIAIYENSSIDERNYQKSLFYEYLNLPTIIFGNSYASESNLGMPTGQTSIIFRYILYFGLVRSLVFFLVFIVFVGLNKFFSRSYLIYFIPIFVALISLDISLSNIFISTLLSASILKRTE